MATTVYRLLRNLLFAAAAFTAGAAWHGCLRGAPAGEAPAVVVERDTVWARDTVRVLIQAPGEPRVVRDTVVMLPPAEPGADSAATPLPIVSRHYGDSLFDAWVSGPVDPRLDSLRLYPRHATVRETAAITRRPSRWGLSVGAGVALTPRGAEPGVFLGVTYTLATFGK